MNRTMDYTKYFLFSEYLTDLFHEKNKQNPSFSVRAFAKFLGYQTPTLLNDVLRGKRKPTIELALRLAHKFAYPKHQADYLVKICEYERSKSNQERDLIMADLRKLLSQKKWQNVTVDASALLSQPFVFVIYNMIALKGFKADANYLNKNFYFKVTQKQVDQAIDVLLKLKYIRVDKHGNYKLAQEQTMISVQGASSDPELADRFNQEMIEVVQSSMRKHSPSQRALQSVLLPIRKSDLRLILDEIAHAHQKVATYAVDSNAEEIYAFSTILTSLSAQASDI
jgi:uncharacterized protein (TIGR02147 family)